MEVKKCSFCGQPYEESKLIKSLEGHICKNCIENLYEDYLTEVCIEKEKEICLKPHIIKNELDKYIIGQEKAKKKLAVEVCNHYKRISLNKKDLELPKSNILLLGPTGSGKTYLLETLAKILDVPLVIGDATGLTETGYKGKDVESLLIMLIEKANGNIKKAEKGIIYIDEIDKIASDISGNKEKIVGADGVQASLLKIIEGMEYTFDRKDFGETIQTINTKNILFVCGGAFDGITDIISKRVSSKGSNIGFLAKANKELDKKDKNELLQLVTPEDLANYGLLKEFIGRLHLIAPLSELSVEELKSILTKPKNAIIKQYKALLRLDGVNLKFEKDAIEYISLKAKEKGTGARALKSVLSEKLNDLLYDLPLKKETDNIREFTVTKEFLSN